MAQAHKRPWLASTMVVLGGALTIAALFLPWFDTGGVNMGANDIAGTPTGFELELGMVLIAAGSVVLLLGLLAMVFGSVHRILGIVAILGALVSGFFVWQVWNEPREAYKAFVAEELNVEAAELDSFDELFEAGLLDSDLQPAVYAAGAGVGLSLLGGLLMLFRRSSRRTDAISTAGGASAPIADDKPDRPPGSAPGGATEIASSEPPPSDTDPPTRPGTPLGDSWSA
jgi:hypothetical protein